MASFNNVISYSERLKVVVRKNLRTIDEKYLTRDAVKVTELVNESINKLPLLFRIPIKWLLVFFGIFDFFCRLLSFNRLSSAKDYNFCYGILRIIPFSDAANKLIRSLTFLHAFDNIHSGSPENR